MIYVPIKVLVSLKLMLILEAWLPDDFLDARGHLRNNFRLGLLLLLLLFS